MAKKYDIPEQEPQMVNEPIVAYAVQQVHTDKCYNMHEIKQENKSEELEIPNTYEEALAMGVMDLDEAQAELLKYVDELAVEFHLP